MTWQWPQGRRSQRNGIQARSIGEGEPVCVLECDGTACAECKRVALRVDDWMTASGAACIVEDPLRRSEQRRALSRAHVTGAQCGKGRGVCASEHGDDGTHPSAVSATQPHDVSGHNGDGRCERRGSAGQRPKANDVWSAERLRGCACCCCLRASAVECTARCCLECEGAAWGAAVVEIRPETEISRPEGLARTVESWLHLRVPLTRFVK